MKAVFIELPAFERHRAEYMDDDAFQLLQHLLMTDPEAGDLIVGTGLFTLYDKDEVADLTPQQRKALKAMIKGELEAR